MGGPAVFGFFLENRTEVLLPTSCAGVEDMLGPRPGAEKERRRVGEGPDVGRGDVQGMPWVYRTINPARIGKMIWGSWNWEYCLIIASGAAKRPLIGERGRKYR